MSAIFSISDLSRCHAFGTNNYKYDETGNLIQDRSEKIAGIQWRADGKISHIYRILNSGKKNLSFDYDPMGNRIAKHQYNENDVWEKSTYYTRDASGNVMAVYEKNGNAYSLIERDIYGSSRLGMDITPVDMVATYGNPLPLQIKHTLGLKQYEMSNHLGNVQAVVTDYKIPVDDGSNGGVANDGIWDYQIASILSAQDYYPFGMAMPGRRFSSLDYRFGFQGQEKDDEIKGSCNSINFKYRMHDPRLGRFFAVDPLASKYPNNSPFAFSENRVIDAVELEGLEKVLLVDQDERPADNGTTGTSYTGELYYLNEKTGDVKGPYEASSYPNSISNSNNATNSNTLNEGTHQYSNSALELLLSFC